jgi:Rne/Rng family ribonuclease
LEILIDEMDASLWVVALDKKRRLEGLEIDPEYEEVRWGSVYWAKVTRIDAALDAAFLDLDGENTGILFNPDIRIKTPDGKLVKGGDKPIGKILSPGQMVAVEAKSGYVPSANDGQLSLEQKSPRMSMNITLPGRYLIYAPLMQENQISQRIRDKKVRSQLLEMLRSLEDIEGCILRSAAQNTQTDMLAREGRILREMWKQIQQYLEGDSPQLIMEGPNAIQRTLSDHSAKTITTIEFVTMEQFEAVEDWCELFGPDLVTKISPIELENPYADLSLFYHRDIMGQIEKMFQPKASLPGGGSIIIEQTAALTSIDVNRGSDKGSNLSTNLEAAAEIARQIRVRNLGGIMIADFLKLKSKKDEGVLIAELEKQFNEDPCTVQIHGMTALGLLEISRARRTPALTERVYS